jgi:predicted thioesterase
MALLLFDEGSVAVTARLEVDLRAPAPVGAFVVVSARVAKSEGRRIELVAQAAGAEEPRTLLAEARGVFVRPAG